MEKKNKETLQNVINKHFDKILDLQLPDRVFRIAIRNDEIPLLIDANVKNDKLILRFNRIIFDEIVHNEFNSSNEDDKSTIIINNISNLKRNKKDIKIGRELIKFKKRLPSKSIIETVKSHKQKRVINAIYDIIKLHIS